MTPHERDDECTDFLVYPFRRQLVDETALREETLERIVQVLPPPRPPARRGSLLEPLRLALPVAAAVFVLSAGLGAVVSAHDDRSEFAVAPAAEAAATPARPHVVRTPVFVPDVRGLKPAVALAALKRRRFLPLLRSRPGAHAGLVVGQAPAAATQVARPGRVVVYVGVPQPKPKPLPAAHPAPSAVSVVASVVGLDKRAAERALLDEGYGVDVYGVPSAQPLDRVVAQAPRPGTRLRRGAYVRINVSAG